MVPLSFPSLSPQEYPTITLFFTLFKKCHFFPKASNNIKNIQRYRQILQKIYFRE